MADPEPTDTPDRTPRTAAAEAERRRRRAEIFGDVLPDATRDDRDPEAGRRGGENDDWLRRNVPPHHG
jgi:hypothetical protein